MLSLRILRFWCHLNFLFQDPFAKESGNDSPQSASGLCCVDFPFCLLPRGAAGHPKPGRGPVGSLRGGCGNFTVAQCAPIARRQQVQATAIAANNWQFRPQGCNGSVTVLWTKLPSLLCCGWFCRAGQNGPHLAGVGGQRCPCRQPHAGRTADRDPDPDMVPGRCGRIGPDRRAVQHRAESGVRCPVGGSDGLAGPHRSGHRAASSRRQCCMTATRAIVRPITVGRAARRPTSGDADTCRRLAWDPTQTLPGRRMRELNA